VALIPARGGSKGIPRKNVVDFCGHPLLAWSIATARDTSAIDRIFVSTDNKEIRDVAIHYGAEVIMRPDDISGDLDSSESALLHALDVILTQHSIEPDRVVFLQATSPLRESAELSQALHLFDAEKYDSLFCAASPEDFCLWKEGIEGLQSVSFDYRNRKRRQEMDAGSKLWIETGSFYITKTTVLRRSRNRLGGKIGIFRVPFWKSHEIDSMEGFALCEWLMHYHKIDRLKPMSFIDPAV
jgi:N-acylneuraminate cytidylyltransferase